MFSSIGETNHIILSKSTQKNLPKPFSECEETIESSKLDNRQINCAEDCYDKVMTQICGCEWPEGCPPSKTSIDCNNAFFLNLTLIKTDCLNKCPIECNQVAFLVKIVNYKEELLYDLTDLTHFVADKQNISKKYNISGQTDEDIRSRMSRVYIYYDKLETTQITQTPKMTEFDLISNIGGILGTHCIFIFIPSFFFLTFIVYTHLPNFIQIGLFLGFSLLSMVELLDLFTRIFLIASGYIGPDLR